MQDGTIYGINSSEMLACERKQREGDSSWKGSCNQEKACVCVLRIEDNRT